MEYDTLEVLNTDDITVFETLDPFMTLDSRKFFV